MVFTTVTVNIPNISKVKFEMSRNLIVFMYQMYGQNKWFLNLCHEISQCFYNGQQYLQGVQDFSIAVFYNKFVISYSEKSNKKLIYKIVDNQQQTTFSGYILIDSQISRPILVNFNNQQIGFAWEFKNNEAQWGLQLSIINNFGDLVKSITNICPLNCDQCISNNECIV